MEFTQLKKLMIVTLSALAISAQLTAEKATFYNPKGPDISCRLVVYCSGKQTNIIGVGPGRNALVEWGWWPMCSSTPQVVACCFPFSGSAPACGPKISPSNGGTYTIGTDGSIR